MRNLSLAIIAIAILSVGFFSVFPKGNTSKPEPVKPPHGENFKISCNVCHNTKSWKIDKETYSFNHDSTEMPLVGQHQQVGCRLCHPTLIFSEAKTRCVQCHSDIHESTVGKECDRCHTPKSWLVNNITQIHQQSRFPLVGVHAAVDCYQCHKSETFVRYDVLGTECYNCHKENFLATTQPNHVTAGFSTDCSECHNIFSNNWTGTGFNHSFFPLTQGHAISDCSQCHKNGMQTKLSPECISCHQSNFDATTNPNHISAGFSTDCKMCHSTAPGWKPATFDHSNFPLTKGHNLNDCSLCHVNGNYSNISSDCASCHLANYNATTNPVHSSLGFSTVCSQCHTTDPGWKPAKFTQHDALFPISSGRHSGFNCTDCHTNTSNYSVYSCTNCHTHNKTDMDDKHSGVNGYVYNSVNCYTCHPNGRAGK
jgi:hypothetical protein